MKKGKLMNIKNKDKPLANIYNFSLILVSTNEFNNRAVFFVIYSMKINRNEYLHISIFNYKIIILSDQ
jgi:hypothetical protein